MDNGRYPGSRRYTDEKERQPKTNRDSKCRTSCSNKADPRANKRGDPAAKPQSSRPSAPRPAVPATSVGKRENRSKSWLKILRDEDRRQPRTEHEPRSRAAPATESATGTGNPKQLTAMVK
ncbi:Hypothetical predicted protein [Podarcis lilfordi]|uniref:Uncharacterized protein n=1 Tax=Podarcis lilfordi TaxID=74358 RepID=A0AA35PK85_9SAUR|nr:Hypothetical predicted protein [Podarcis lilfordi]